MDYELITVEAGLEESSELGRIITITNKTNPKNLEEPRRLQRFAGTFLEGVRKTNKKVLKKQTERVDILNEWRLLGSV